MSKHRTVELPIAARHRPERVPEDRRRTVWDIRLDVFGEESTQAVDTVDTDAL